MKQNKNNNQSLKNIYFFTGDKYNMEILYYLSLNKLRFSEIKNNIGTITQQLLTKRLRQMENDLLINRKAYKGYPRRVEYSLSTFGKSLIPVISSMQKWEQNNFSKILKILKKNNPKSLYDYY